MFPGAEFGFLSLPLGEGSHRIPGINNSSRLDAVAAPDDTISLGHSGIAASGTAVAIKSKKLVLIRGQLPLVRICPFFAFDWFFSKPGSLQSSFLSKGSVGNDGIFAIDLRALPNLQSFRFAAADDLKAAWFVVEREDSEGSVF